MTSGCQYPSSCGNWKCRYSGGSNSSAGVTLFDTLHANKVLSSFGQAFGRLPENLGDLSTAEQTFLDQAVKGLAQDGKIISVRLALFAEMMKGKPWTPASLRGRWRYGGRGSDVSGGDIQCEDSPA